MNERCPRCQGPVRQMEPKLFRCDQCKMLTDCQDDGTVGYGSQIRHAERKEEFQIRQRERQERLKENRSRLFDRYGDRRRYQR